MPSRHKDHLIYRRPLPGLPGNVHLHLFDGGTKFADIADLKTGILSPNDDFISPDHWHPRNRFLYDLRPGQYIENDALSGKTVTQPTITEPWPFTWQATTNLRMPNFDVSLKQFLEDLPGAPGGWAEFTRHIYNWSDGSKFAPIGSYLYNRGAGEGQEYYANTFYEPLPDDVAGTMVIQANPGAGVYGLKYLEGIEAEGSINTDNKDDQGRTVWQMEAPFFEPIGDAFFHSFDTTDTDTFKVTAVNDNNAEEVGFQLPIDEIGSSHLNVYLIPRQWFYFIYVLTWYLIITPFTYYYYPSPIAGSFYDRPPVHPYPYVPTNYWGPIYGGKDDYGVYWKVIHHPKFLEILSTLNDLETVGWMFGIVFVGVEYFYYRVRSFPALGGQLCAVIENVETADQWYVWHKAGEIRDTYTLVDCFFWPENYQPGQF